MQPHLYPLEEGCEVNRRNWAKIAAGDADIDTIDADGEDTYPTKNMADENDREKTDKDDDEGSTVSQQDVKVTEQ